MSKVSQNILNILEAFVSTCNCLKSHLAAVNLKMWAAKVFTVRTLVLVDVCFFLTRWTEISKKNFLTRSSILPITSGFWSSPGRLPLVFSASAFLISLYVWMCFQRGWDSLSLFLFRVGCVYVLSDVYGFALWDFVLKNYVFDIDGCLHRSAAICILLTPSFVVLNDACVACSIDNGFKTSIFVDFELKPLHEKGVKRYRRSFHHGVSVEQFNLLF